MPTFWQVSHGCHGRKRDRRVSLGPVLGVRQEKDQRECLELGREAGLDIGMVTKTVVEKIRSSEPVSDCLAVDLLRYLFPPVSGCWDQACYCSRAGPGGGDYRGEHCQCGCLTMPL